MSENLKRELVKWTGIIAALTALSKVLGFVREASIAYVFGAGVNADAYFMALLVPTILFNAFHNAIARAFIPVYGGIRHREDSRVFANTFFLILVPAMGALALAVAVFSPQLVRVLAPGFSGEAYALTVILVRVLAFALMFMAMAGMAAGFLQANHSFMGPALVGLPMNIIIITGALCVGPRYGIIGLAAVTVAAYASQFLVQVPWLARLRFSLRVGFDRRHAALKELKKIMMPVLFAGAAAELKALIDRVFASLLPMGAVSSLNYAARVRGLPVSLLIVPLVTVVYPNLVDLAAAGEHERFKQTLSRSMGVVIFLLMPISAGMLVFSFPLTRLIYQRGAFDDLAAATTAVALLFYCIGMVGEGLNHLLACSFFALKDTRTPMKLTFFTTALNALLNASLIGPLKHGGIALATSVCFLVGEGLALYLLRRKIGPIGGKILLRGAALSFVLSAVMAGGVYCAYASWQKAWQPLSFGGQALQVGSLIAAGAAFYFIAAWLLQIREMREALTLAGQILRKLKK